MNPCSLIEPLESRIAPAVLTGNALTYNDIDGDAVTITANQPSELLLLAAQPIKEPVVRYGPFVMNTSAELQQAFEDYRQGKMGTISITG